MSIFNSIKNEKKIINERKAILDFLYQADKWDGCYENTEYYQEIFDKLSWLWKRLDLAKLELLSQGVHSKGNKAVIAGLPLGGYITSRQINCLDNVIYSLRENKIQGAYHELCDFIHNYNQTEHEPISYFEKFILRYSIREFEYVLEKSLKEGK